MVIFLLDHAGYFDLCYSLLKIQHKLKVIMNKKKAKSSINNWGGTRVLFCLKCLKKPLLYSLNKCFHIIYTSTSIPDLIVWIKRTLKNQKLKLNIYFGVLEILTHIRIKSCKFSISSSNKKQKQQKQHYRLLNESRSD